MIVQAFISSWPGQHPDTLVSRMRQLCTTTLLDDPTHYGTGQWNEVLRLFTGDIALCMMADVSLTDLEDMYKECKRFLARPDIGVYAPNVCWTTHTYQLPHLQRVEEQVYEVPCADMLCWAIHRDVIVDRRPLTSKYGWGIDYMVTALGNRIGRKTVRDYRFTADHPRGSGYNVKDADADFWRWFVTIEPALQAEISALVKQGDRFR